MGSTARSYLDWNASAPLRPEAFAAMAAAGERVGNPSSVHAEGRAARRVIEEARQDVAALAGGDPGHVVFTSGGTEANTLALTPGVRAEGGSTPTSERLLVSAVEHPSVLCGGRFAAADMEQVPVAPSGIVDLEALERRLVALAAEGVRPFLSLMLANNETGVIQPVAAAAALVHGQGGLVHVDAVQAVGRIACDIGALGADLLTLSAHKLGGPKGAGALVRREGITLPPLLRGGGQERGLRAGTENVAAIAGFGAAAEAAHRAWRTEAAHMAALRDRLEAGLAAITANCTIFGAGAERLPNTTLFTAPGLKAETAVIAFDLGGVALSSGAACSSGKVQPSHVLAAMGVPKAAAQGALRLSLGRDTAEADIDRALAAWRKVSETLLNRTKELAA